MARNMSFMLTTDQQRAKSKTVTRRNGWKNLKPGEIVNACEKCQGLKKGEKVKRINQIRVVSVTREPLKEIGNYPDDCAKEGFPDLTPDQFVAMYCQHNGGDENQEVTRIEYEHVRAERRR